MSGLFGAAPPTPPAPPSSASPAVIEGMDAQAIAAANARGQQSTFLANAQAATSGAPATTRKTLLGGGS